MAIKYDLLIDQGGKFQTIVAYESPQGTRVSFAGASARMMLRVLKTDASPTLSLTPGAGLTLGGTAGTVTINITPAQSLALTVYEGVYDLDIDPDGAPSANSYRLMEGTWRVNRNVTT